MDISDSLSTNNTELNETMGSILSTSNENETSNIENDPVADETTQESNSTSQIIEVSESENNVLDSVESYSETLSEQDINLIIMGEPPGNDKKISLSEVPSTSHIEEHEELWLSDNTQQLVKVDTDEDFEVIVKSLETAIVETEHYDDTNEEPVASASENSLGISIIDTNSGSLLEDIPSNLLTSTVAPFPENELQVDGPYDIVGRILPSTIESPEFATISEPKVDSFDEQSSSLFDAMEPEIDIPIENEPSLLELQEATMPTDIPKEFKQSLVKEESILFRNVEIGDEDIKQLDVICETSSDSESLEKSLVAEQTRTEEIEETLIKFDEKYPENENIISMEEVLEMDTSEIEAENITEEISTDGTLNKTVETEIDEQISQEEIFKMSEDIEVKNNIDINEEVKDFKDNSTVLDLEMENTSKLNENCKDSEINLPVTEKAEEDIKEDTILSKNQEEEEIIHKETVEEINKEINIIHGLQHIKEPEDAKNLLKTDLNNEMEKDTVEQKDNKEITEKTKVEKNINEEQEISEKEECVDSSNNKNMLAEIDIIQEVPDSKSEIGETQTNVECKKKEIVTTDLQLLEDSAINISTKSEITKAYEIEGKIEINIDDPVPAVKIETFSSKELQKEILSPKETEEKILISKDAEKEICSTSKSLKHSLDADEKEQSPPKKIKLVREKLQVKRAKSELEKNDEIFIESENKTQEISIEIQTVQPTEEKEKPVVEGKETIEQILEKLEDPRDKIENKSPVKAQKLKLQRNYKLPSKLPEKPVKEKTVTKKVEKPIIVSEIKTSIVAQSKSDTVSTKEDISQPSLVATKDSTTEINIVATKSEKDKIQPKSEIKLVELVSEVINQPIETISAPEISESNDNAKLIAVKEIAPEIPENNTEITEIDIKIVESEKNLEEIQEVNITVISKVFQDIDKEQKTENEIFETKIEHNTDPINIEPECSELKIEGSSLIINAVFADNIVSNEDETEDSATNILRTEEQKIDVFEKKEESLRNDKISDENITLEEQEITAVDISRNVEEQKIYVAENYDNIVEEMKEESSAVKDEIIQQEDNKMDVEILENTETVPNSAAVIINESIQLLENVDDENIEIPLIVEEKVKDSEIITTEITENVTESEMKSLSPQIETQNIVDKKEIEEKCENDVVDTEKIEDSESESSEEEETETESSDSDEAESTDETERIIDTKKIVEQKFETVKKINIINIDTEKRMEKINKSESREYNDEVDKAKTDTILTIDTKFPLLSSRLQEKLQPRASKYTGEIKISPVSFPITHETVSKKLQEQFIGRNITISKQELSKSEATSRLAYNPEITLTKQATSSAPDHLATMESATKIKITKRKLDISEPIVTRSVTKPLSVQVDDLESSIAVIERSHSSGSQRESENIPKIVIKPIPKPEGRSSPKITIKPIKPPEETISKSRMPEESSHSPKITIKPIVKPDPLKITITKQKTDDTHSILKIYQPEDNQMHFSDHHIPKLTIKSIPKSDEMQHSPRITIKQIKQSPSGASISPKITVKPIPSPSDQVEIIHSPKITVKPIVNPEESYPKVTIKPVLRPEETHKVSQLSPRQLKLKSMTFESSSGVTVEPICGTGHMSQKQGEQENSVKISVKQFAKMEESLSPKLTIKPITKTCEIVQSEFGTSNPLKLTIKPILKPEEMSYQSPKITIKPIVKPDDQQLTEELDKPERIILKIQKTNLPSPKERIKESKKEPEIKIEAIPHDPEKNQKLDKIKLKLTKEGSHAQIIPSISSISSEGSFSLKRSLGISDSGILEKRSKTEFPGTEILHTSDISINIVEPNAKPSPKTISEEVTIMKIDKISGSRAPSSEQHISQSKFKEMLMKIQQKPDITCTPHVEPDADYSSSSDDVKIVEVIENEPLKDPLSIHDESSSQDVMIVNEVINPFQNIQIINAHSVSDSNLQTPKKRGRPRKNPLEVKPEIKGEDCVEVRPKRTCRAPPGRTPFAVKERKPRGAGRARGSSRGRGASKSPQKSPKEVKTPRGKALKEAKALAKIEAARLAQEVVIDEITIEDSTNDTPAATPVPPAEDSPKKPEVKESEPPPQMVEPEVKVSQITEELPKQPPPSAVYEEETRMSADNSSRAQTPARQVFTAPLVEGPEESQSSVQSTATTESSKTKKGRLEVCDPDSAVTTVDQIVEYSWANGGPYMLQEQIAQYLGVKSFKRKYPGLIRRPVEMQERDYIREKGLVSESMCDMGLTAVPSSEILDIMYSDFQEKYEEYRKCLRDKQAKEISNKQKAVSLATSQEKNKIDFKERAIKSAASWNLNFNKARKETRKCCMDLQTFTINYPSGKVKVPYKIPVGNYPLALVPGQYTDYYKSYTTNDLHYLPLNTVRYGPVIPNQRCEAGQSDGSQSDSDSSSGSDSDSSDDSMSTEDEVPTPVSCKPATVPLTQVIATPKSKVH